jgi:RNA polymerase sigma-70 factor (ECF subfamily)
MTSISDPSIFQRIKNGDENAFSSLFNTYYAPLCQFAVSYLKDTDQARSLVQQLFVDIWQKRDRIKVEISVKSYLYHSVKNRCIDILRRSSRSEELSAITAGEASVPFRDLIEEAELTERISRAIDRLPPRCREIFILCRSMNLKYSEIARQLDISVKTVEMQMGIALKRLRRELSEK